jgi:hypothetical protein
MFAQNRRLRATCYGTRQRSNKCPFHGSIFASRFPAYSTFFNEEFVRREMQAQLDQTLQRASQLRKLEYISTGLKLRGLRALAGEKHFPSRHSAERQS